MSFDKETMGYIGLAFTIVSFAPYYYSIFQNRTKPHAFSWLIWSILTAIGFVAQYGAGAGAGAWVTGVSSILCFTIALLACFKGERHITRSDRTTFLLALSIIPCWLITKDPLLAIILVTIIDMLGYYPTFRKSYHKPHEELLFTHLIGALKYVFAIMAIETLTLTTWLYPASIVAANMLLVFMLALRRRTLSLQAVL